jgi:hypothetical protein
MPSIVGPAMAAPLAPAARPPETARAATPKPVVTTAAAQPRPIATAMAAPPKPAVKPAAVPAPAATPARQAPTPAITQVAAASPLPPRPAYPIGGSVLGVRGSLPPPVPFGSANAATLESQYGLR